MKDAGNLTPFLIASKFGFVDVIEILLENNANVHALDHRGYNGLMLAVENNQEQVVQVACLIVLYFFNAVVVAFDSYDS